MQPRRPRRTAFSACWSLTVLSATSLRIGCHGHAQLLQKTSMAVARAHAHAHDPAARVRDQTCGTTPAREHPPPTIVAERWWWWWWRRYLGSYRTFSLKLKGRMEHEFRKKKGRTTVSAFLSAMGQSCIERESTCGIAGSRHSRAMVRPMTHR